MAKAGANYGMALLWTILLSCLVTYFLIYLFGRFTLITGETALQAFKKHIHPGVGIFFIVALTVGVCGSVIGVMGIITDVLFVWSKQWTAEGIQPVVWAAFFIAALYVLFLVGKTKFFEKVLAMLVAVMGFCFILNFFLMMPPLGDILKGLVPLFPDAGMTDGKGPFLVIASMVGTTVASVLFIVRTTLVKEAGWTLDDEWIQKRDARVSAILMFLISASIMAAAAGTLYAKGMGLNKASDMVGLLEPIAGKGAVTIFIFGIVAAGLSSQFPNVLLLPWLLCDYNNWETNLKRNDFRIYVLLISLLGLIVPLFKASPVFVMIASQAFSTLVLPSTVGCIFYLVNKKSLMGEHRADWKINLPLSLIMIFALIMFGIGIKGLAGRFL